VIRSVESFFERGLSQDFFGGNFGSIQCPHAKENAKKGKWCKGNNNMYKKWEKKRTALLCKHHWEPILLRKIQLTCDLQSISLSLSLSFLVPFQWKLIQHIRKPKCCMYSTIVTLIYWILTKELCWYYTQGPSSSASMSKFNEGPICFKKKPRKLEWIRRLHGYQLPR
jgi:hypothetical protein